MFRNEYRYRFGARTGTLRYWVLIGLVFIIMEEGTSPINFNELPGDSCVGPSHGSPGTPLMGEQSLLDDDMGMEQQFLGTEPGQSEELKILSQAIDSFKGVFVDTVAQQKSCFEESVKICTMDVPKKTLLVLEKANTDFLEVLGDRMQMFTNQTIEAIQWNSKQSHSELKELLDNANISLLSSFKAAIQECDKGENELLKEVLSLKKQLLMVQTSLEALCQKSTQPDSRVTGHDITATQVCSGKIAQTVQCNSNDVIPVSTNLACGRVLPIRMVFPSFGGEQDETDPVIYLERCKDYLALRPMLTSELLATMRSVLHASARDWWETVRLKIGSWEDFQKAFLAAFLSDDYQDELEDRVRDRLQGANESIRDFAFSFQALFKRWKTDATDEEVVKALLKAMNPCFASQLRGRVQTVDELVKLGTQLERDYNHQRKYNQLQLSKTGMCDQNVQARKTKEADSIINPLLGHRNPSLLCWRCQENHSPGSCPTFKASLRGKSCEGQPQRSKDSQGRGQPSGLVSAYDTQRLLVDSNVDMKGGSTILRQLIVPLTVRNGYGKALVDTGATYTLLNIDLWNKLKSSNEQLDPWHGEPLYLANGDATAPLGQKVLDFYMHGMHFQIPTVVLPAQKLVYSVVLGLDFISLAGLQLNIKDQLYSFSGDSKNRVFPFQPPITPGDTWKYGKVARDWISTASLYSSIPPIQFEWTESECMESDVQEESSQDTVELVESKVIESNLPAKESHVLFTLLYDHPEVCTSTLGRTNLVQHKIHVRTNVVVAQKPYRLPVHKKQIVKEQIDDMLARDIVQPSHSPWASPIVLVPKKEGGQRFCVDYRRVNAVSESDAFPLPTVSEILESLAGASVFSTLDLNSGYWQVAMDPESMAKTAFVSPFGLYEFRVLPFGLKNAPATFQRLMNRVLADWLGKCCLVYLDDIVIYSTSFSQHIQDLRKVLLCLRNAGLTLKLQKCHFCLTEVKFLGHVVTPEGVKADTAKTEAIQNFPIPKNLKELQRFLGMSGWYHRYVPNFSDIAEPLNALKRKGVRFQWTADCQASFESLKRHLTTSPILGHPNHACTFIVYTDASATGLGAVLAQRSSIFGIAEEVLAYASRTLTSAERNYSTTERECLAVVWAIGRWSHYLEGKPFIVVTDHASLLWVFNTTRVNSRLIRWALRLQEFEFTLEYRKGKLNSAPDALSRVSSLDSSPIVAAYAHKQTPSSLSLQFPLSDEDVWVAQQQDVEVQKVYQKITENQQSSDDVDSGFVILEDKVYRKVTHPFKGTHFQVYVPQSLRQTVMEAYHSNPLSGHFGRYKTQKRLMEVAFWPHMWRDVSEFVKNCVCCQQYKPECRKPAGMLQQTEAQEPWELLGMDLMGPLPRSTQGNTQLLVVVDYYSHWVELFPIRKASAETIAQILRKEILTRWGVPKFFLSDRGPQFTSDVLKQLCSRWGIVQKLTTAYHPQTNFTERVNRTIKVMISSYLEGEHNHWDHYLPELRYAINSAVQESTGYSPAELLLHRRIIGPVERILEPQQTSLRVLKDLQGIVQQNLSRAKEKQKCYYDAGRQDVVYAKNDRVWMKAHPLSKASQAFSAKFAPQWIGPYRVVEKLGPVNYRIVREDNGEDLRTVHVCNLKPAYPSAAEVDHKEKEKVLQIFAEDSEEEDFWGF